MSKIPEGCKPFNLQEALVGKPVVTRDGRKVKIAGYNPEALDKSEVVLGWADGRTREWGQDGVYVCNRDNPSDLFMAPETKDVWVILMQRSFGITAIVRETKEDAEAFNANVDEILLGKTFGIHKITINQ